MRVAFPQSKDLVKPARQVCGSGGDKMMSEVKISLRRSGEGCTKVEPKVRKKMGEVKGS